MALEGYLAPCTLSPEQQQVLQVPVDAGHLDPDHPFPEVDF